MSYPSTQNDTSAVITSIYDVFIETRYFIFLAVLEKEFFKILTWCKVVCLPRKHCRFTVRPCGYIVWLGVNCLL